MDQFNSTNVFIVPRDDRHELFLRMLLALSKSLPDRLGN